MNYNYIKNEDHHRGQHHDARCDQTVHLNILPLKMSCVFYRDNAEKARNFCKKMMVLKKYLTKQNC